MGQSNLARTRIFAGELLNLSDRLRSGRLFANGEKLQVYMDGKQLNCSVASTLNSWVITFNYSHSTHQIRIQLESNASSKQPVSNEAILIDIMALFCTFLVATITTLLLYRRHRKPISQNKPNV